ncbi:MAG: serine/threonine-protein kinase PknK [Planctomycetota bacterium]
MATAFTGTERYEVERLLGQGGMGTVYAVFDRRRQRKVALKVLLDTDAGSLFRFKREFRAVADLRHPNLVRLYDLGVLPTGGFFFTMELVEGLDLAAWIDRRRQESRRTVQVGAEGASGGDELLGADVAAETQTSVDQPPADAEHTAPWVPPPVGVDDGDDASSEVARVLAEVAEGLDYLHAARKVHRDLKPSNVMVDGQGRAKLLDFGILRDLDRAGLTVEGAVGTPLYMAPEQVAGEETGPPADLYALGCILYQLLTGRPPFVGRAARVLMQHMREVPPPPSSLKACDPRLDRLAEALLQKEAAARPLLAEVRETLWDVAGERPHTTSTAAAPPRDAELLGREGELRHLEQAYRDAAARAQVVLIGGESGAGKSALAAEFARRCPEGVVPWFGGCYEREHVPYKAFDAIVDAVAVDLARRGEEAFRLLPPGTAALSRIFPVLREVPVIARLDPETPLRDAQAERARAGKAFFALLTNLNGGAAPLLIIDDLQRSDQESLEAISWLGLPDAPPALVVGTFRSEEVDEEHALNGLLEQERVSRLDLPPLDRAASDELARSCAGTTLSETQLARLAEDARGNPFLVVELARAAAHLRQDALPTVDELVNERLSDLSAAPRRVLEVAAVVGGRAGFPLLQAGAELEAAALADALDELLRVQLLREVQGRGEDAYDLIHDRLRAAIYERVPPARRQALHRELAALLAAGGEPARAVEHHRLGDEPEAAREAALAAAREAEQQLAFDKAAALYGLALGGADADVDRAVLVELAGALAKAGRHSEAAAAYERAEVGAPGPEKRELLLAAATRRIAAGDTGAGVAHFQRLLGQFGKRIRQGLLANFAAVIFGFLRLMLGWFAWDMVGRYRTRRRVAEVVPPTPDQEFEIRLYDAVHQSLTVTRPLEAAQFGVLHALRSRGVEDPKHQGRARIGYAMFLAGELGTLARWRGYHHLEIGEALCSEAKDAAGLLMAHVARAFMALLQSNWEEVSRVSDEAQALARKAGLFGEPNLLVMENIHLGAELFRGRPDQVVESALEYVAAARARGNVLGVAWPASMLGYALLWRGERERAARAFAEAVECTTPEPLTVVRLHVELETLALDLYDERYDEGLAKLAELNKRWRCSGMVASSLENGAYRLTLARFRLLRAIRTGQAEHCILSEGLQRLLPAPASIREELLRLEAAQGFHAGHHRAALARLDCTLRLAERRGNWLGRGLALIARARVREALELPGAQLDRERGERVLAAIGCEGCYLLRTEGWEEPAAPRRCLS